MQSFAIIGILLSVTAVMVESTCNIYQMTTVQIDFCDYAQVITDLVPGIVSANQLEHCIANMDKDMCRPVNDCADSENMMAEAMSLLNDILNDNSCTDPCTASPCVHGSCTRLTSQTYSCACDAGYSGTNCAQEIDECACNPCQNGGMCVDGINSFTCTCEPGYGGTNCNLDIDECASNPCVNGVCLDGINSFSCICEGGYEGTHCELDIDECASNPCVNGVCVDGINSYSCNCEAGYEGTQCEDDINECATNPCLNGGMCVDGINSFTCNCAPGYEGERCDIEIDFCGTLPCANGGECTSAIGGFTCTCALGFTGETCELDIDECVSGPCLNDGFCDNTYGGYICDCASGFDGVNCENDIDECASQPCQNGQCVDGVDSFTCQCADGYEGTLCEIDIDDCASSPCENGGVCSDSVNGYTCTCSFGFKGTNCENVANVGSGAACYVESDGSDYRGEQSTTVSGYPCQYWANTYPHHISNLEHFLFHDDSNYCRNYAGSGKLAPWCYTGLEEVEWEYCEGIPTAFDACTDKPAIEDFTEQKAAFDAIADYDRAECYTDPTGLDYTGYIGQTEGGFECQRWDVNYPNARNDANKSKPRHNSILFGSHNYCRNNGKGPDGDTDRPWCWIADTTAGERWGYCDTARYLNSSCPGKGTPHEQARVGRYPECMLTARGPDYVGNVNTTESGLTCIAWGDLDSSNKYNQLFSTQGNKCRSFDTSDDWGRPWCYVSQTETEKCRVKDHYDQCFEAI